MIVVGLNGSALAVSAKTCRLGVCADASWSWWEGFDGVNEGKASGEHWIGFDWTAQINTSESNPVIDTVKTGLGELFWIGIVVDQCTFNPPNRCHTKMPLAARNCQVATAKTDFVGVTATDTAWSPAC